MLSTFISTLRLECTKYRLFVDPANCMMIFVDQTFDFSYIFQVADYDTSGSVLRIRGKNILENEHVKVITSSSWLLYLLMYNSNSRVMLVIISLQIGAFHTLELELHRPFVLRKVCFLISSKMFTCSICCWDHAYIVLVASIIIFSSVLIIRTCMLLLQMVHNFSVVAWKRYWF